MKAVILAAGRGTRLGALTQEVPKPMLEVAGKPLLSWILEGLQAAGATECWAVVGYLGERIRRYYGDSLSYIQQTEISGTGGALQLAEEHVNEPFMACFADILLHPVWHYAQMARLFQTAQPQALLAANAVEDPCVGAAVYFDQTQRITQIVEKPAPGTSSTRYNQAGCFVFTPDIFHALRQIQPSPRGELELTAALNYMLSQNLELMAYPLPEQDWIDIGTPDLLQNARHKLSGEQH
ncbi:MAG: NTP transferase domain-containing protein [Armatimonadetes bacterium]|nr:NTP transferase domain-containing protein [Armatimonadota bacterium]